MIRNIQGLRALAALLVVCVHFGNSHGFEQRYLGNVHPYTELLSRIGYFGVDLFFIISGFIMVVTTFREDGRTLSAWEFFKRRCIRIYPPLWIVNTAILAIFLVKPSLVNAHSSVPTDVLASYLLLPQAGNALVLVSWTLVYEMLFYIVFAIGLLGGARAVAGTLAAWAVAIACAQAAFPSPDNVYQALLQNPIVYEFILGTVVAVLSRQKWPSSWFLFAGAVGVVSTLGIMAAIAFGGLAFPEGWARVVCALPLACIVLGAVAHEARFGTITPQRFSILGDASYAIYLWHVPALTAVGIVMHSLHLHGAIAQFIELAIALTLSVQIGVLIYRHVELPVTDWLRRRFMRRQNSLAAETTQTA